MPVYKHILGSLDVMHHRNCLKISVAFGAVPGVSEKARRLICNIAGVLILCLFPLSATIAFAGCGNPVEKASPTVSTPPQSAPPAMPNTEPKPQETTPTQPQESSVNIFEKSAWAPVPTAFPPLPPARSLVPRLTPEEYAARANEMIAVIKGNASEQEKAEAESELLSLHGMNAMSHELAAEIYEQWFNHEISQGKCSVSLASIAAMEYSVSSQPDRAVACLEGLIQHLSEGKLEFESYREASLKTPEARAAAIEDIRRKILKTREGSTPSRVTPEALADLAASTLGAIPVPLDASDEKKDEYRKAQKATQAHDFAKAEKILLSLGDREAAAAAVAAEAASSSNVNEVLDRVISKYPGTRQAELAFYQQAVAYRAKGEQARYLAVLKEYLSKYPDGVRALEAVNEIVRVTEREGRSDEAIIAREKLQETYKKKKIVWMMNVMGLEQAYRKKGDLDSVKRLLEDTISQLENPETQLYGFDEKSDSELSRYNYLEQLRKALAELNEETQPVGQK